MNIGREYLRSKITNHPDVELEPTEDTPFLRIRLCDSDISDFVSTLSRSMRYSIIFYPEDISSDEVILHLWYPDDEPASLDISSPPLSEIYNRLVSLQNDMLTHTAHMSADNPSLSDATISGEFTFSRSNGQLRVQIPFIHKHYYRGGDFEVLFHSTGISQVDTTSGDSYIEYTFHEPISESPFESERAYGHYHHIAGKSVPLKCSNCSEYSVLSSDKMFICKNCDYVWLVTSASLVDIEETYDSLAEYQETYMDTKLFDSVPHLKNVGGSPRANSPTEPLPDIGVITKEFFTDEWINDSDGRRYSICSTETGDLALGVHTPTYSQYIQYDSWDDPVTTKENETAKSNCYLCGVPLAEQSPVLYTTQYVVPKDYPKKSKKFTEPLCLACHNTIYPKFQTLLDEHTHNLFSDLI